MKTLLTLDEAFSSENIIATEHALFNMCKVGIYDPNFLPTALLHIRSQESKEAVENCMPYEGFTPSKITLQ